MEVPVRAAAVAWLVGFAAYAVALLVGVGVAPAVQVAYAILVVGPTAVVVARAITGRSDRLPWSLMAAGLVAWAAGVVWQVAATLRGGTLPYPSPADAMWLALYPFAFAALASFVRRSLHRPSLSVVVDAAMVALALAAVATAVVLPAVLAHGAVLGTLGTTVNVAYPIADTGLVAVTGVAGLLLGRRAGLWWVLAAGSLVLLAADTLWTLHTASTVPEPTTTADGLYPLFPAAVAAAALRGRGAVWSSRGEEVHVLLAALASAVVALVLLALDDVLALPAASPILALLALLAVLHRMAAAVWGALRASRGARRSRAVADDVRRALANGELELHFQPLLDVRTDRVAGAEALVRWRRGGALVAPDEFLPAVEQSDLIGPLSDFVVDRALAALAGWRQAGHELGVAVNLAPRNLSEEDLPDRVAAALRRHGIVPELLTLELTETAAVADDATAVRVLAGLKDVGVELSIDDFGTGHSSLARVAQFPIDEVKVDRSFVAEMHTAARPIVATTVHLAHTLGLRVVAEGVEDAETLNALRSVGCDVAQGYHVARPLAADELQAWLGDRRVLPRRPRQVQAVLDALVQAVGLEAAFVAQLDGEAVRVQAYRGPRTFGPLGLGAAMSREDGYCDRVVRGVFPQLMPRVAHDERTRDMAITRAARIGTYLGVPLHAADGELYGTLCCVSHSSRLDLGEREVGLVHRAAETLRPLLDGAGLTLASRPAAGAAAG